jgi:putative hydrolase of the HAD superfamily
MAIKMVLFDYGETIVHEGSFDGLRGTRALIEHVVENPFNASPEEIRRLEEGLYFSVGANARKVGAEVPSASFRRFANEYFQLKFSLPLDELEEIYWDSAASASPQPHVNEMLEALGHMGMRTAVISNTGFSGELLKRRIDKVLPGNTFEFALATCDYGIRKPNPLIFELALRKAGILPEEAIFCGNNGKCDIEGAKAAGLHAVKYGKAGTREPSLSDSQIQIDDWLELIEVVRRMAT